MKAICVLLILNLFAGTLLFGQSTPNSLPFIIEGQLKNFASKQVILTITTASSYIADTINVTDGGKFYYQTYKVTKPIKALFSKNSAFFRTDLFIAPGYHLVLNADAKSAKTSKATKTISGTGASTNRYLFMLDSINGSRPQDTSNYYDMAPASLLAYINKKQKLSDSLMRVVFTKNTTHDRYFDVFKKMTEINIKLGRLYYLTQIGLNRKYDYATSVAFVKDNMDSTILNNLWANEYLDLDYYVNFMKNSYFTYLAAIACKKAGGCDDKYYRIQNLDAIANNYKGPIKAEALHEELGNAIFNCRSFDELNIYRDAMPKYMAMIFDRNQKDELNKLYAGREARLIKTATGKQAPAFTAQDTLGTSFSIADFIGKVVLLDLWASWCGPCRGESPFLKHIVEKYKGNERIAFISVAVQDKLNDWKKAMQEDKPTWLQLFDTDKKVQRGYIAASIPKFIVINKQGNIVSFDAPEPHQTAELEKMLDAEIAK